MNERENNIRNGDNCALLARWYATPLDHDTAHALLHTAQQREAVRVRRGKSCYTCRLQRMIAHFWLGKEIDEEFRALHLRLSNTAHGRILAEMIYGQLLISQRRMGALTALDQAFHEARSILSASDYFVIFKRHGLLHRLPLSQQPQTALPLDDLLTTAAVIERLSTSTNRKRVDDGHSV